MRTPDIAFTPTRQQIAYHDREGRSRTLQVCQDGQLEAVFGAQLKDGFVGDLNDPRLVGAELTAAQLGNGWTYSYAGGEKLRLYCSPSSEQLLASQEAPDGSRTVSLTTRGEQGEHFMSAVIRDGLVQPDSIRESAQLEVSPAGLNVYRDGKVLFEMPGAFTGGCSW